jgi:predicted  nucleic acid-binding Zn-ribbon protein
MPEEMNYKEQLDKLIDLQKIDSEIYGLRLKKDSFPVRIEELNNSLQEKTGNMDNAEKELKDLQVAHSGKETDMAAGEEKIKKLEGDLYQIKTNKEYKAIEQEIESLKADVSLLEEDIINLLDKIEAAKVKHEEEKKLFEEEKQKTGREQESIKAEEKEVDARLNELDGKRKESSRGIDAGILARYEKVLENRGEKALSKVSGESCSECNMTLRPQAINEAKIKKSPVFCENCSRILYAEEE